MKITFSLRSPMQRTMLALCLAGLAGCGLFAALYHANRASWLLSCAISFGMVAYHMLIRFAAPCLLRLLHRGRYDWRSPWFRPRAWEAEMYRRLGVQRWKALMPTWDPEEFSLESNSLAEIASNMCHAEAVHELIMLLSFTSLLFAIPFGSFGVFLVTAVLAAAFDSVFVVMQRYNRPRITAILERRERRAQKRQA